MSDRILLAHGGGGRLSEELIATEILPRFAFGGKQGLPDGVTLNVSESQLVVSTDSFVVNPLFFPGASIGHLAVHGTVNDVSVSGAKVAYLTLALILEEGLPMDTLREILDDIKKASVQCGVEIVCGDTKVVGKGQCDGAFINTTGIGFKYPEFDLSTAHVKEGDVVIVNGTLGDHGMAVMAFRNSMPFQNSPKSDSAAVNELVDQLRPFNNQIKFMRDPTRGGVASVLNEIVSAQGFGIELDEEALPFDKRSRAMSEILGLDLLHSACEGRLLLICSAEIADEVLSLWRDSEVGSGSEIIGKVCGEKDAGRVTLKTTIGGRRIVDMPHGELLPRIC
ncbi:MAG: hydrogenase expression/formation protein HypE [Planctomycetes bacterium]|nr:hydrogenase expression/formation protein HypE [Planctomycetota bacterium]